MAPSPNTNWHIAMLDMVTGVPGTLKVIRTVTLSIGFSCLYFTDVDSEIIGIYIFYLLMYRQ